MAENQGQLTLAQNQHAFIQDLTKGYVQVHSGPVSTTLSQTDRPVVYDAAKDTYTIVPVDKAIQQNPLVPEGHYLVLENPSFDSDVKLTHPGPGGQPTPRLSIGRKIIIPGPTTFSLWPGQHAEVIGGHHLRSNQYLVVRVYNAEEANKNRVDASVSEDLKEAVGATKPLENGQLFVIKGTEVSFFMPKTGYEVLQKNGAYVREALTLERLEYAILLGENGEKRYEIGPQVVFPKATEEFVSKKTDGGASALKFKAIELNDAMGLYVKVIADYIDPDKTEHKAGDELFITGKQQRIYYPRPEHALIQYRDPESNFMRERYYAITIPKGEARYILDKEKGEIITIEGPKMFLADPRTQTYVRRVLDKSTVTLWYPGNAEAQNYNETLRGLSGGSNYVDSLNLLASSADRDRSFNRGTKGAQVFAASAPVSSVEDSGNDRMTRSGNFTPPPMLTLNTKYDGVPAIGIWTGYAVQVVDKNGGRKVVVGPTTRLLAYDESLEVLSLSTGKPKTTDNLKRDTYLRFENNLVSDVVNIITKDNVEMEVKVSYRVSFALDQKEKWFSVENYVKFLCDHTRSLIKAAAKKYNVQQMNDESTTIVRDVVLGAKEPAEISEPGEVRAVNRLEPPKPRQRKFSENGMVITDVEVLGLGIKDPKIAQLLKASQTETVEITIKLAAEEHNLALTKRKIEVQEAVAKATSNLTVATEKLKREEEGAQAETLLLRLNNTAEQEQKKAETQLVAQKAKAEVEAILLEITKAADEQMLSTEEKRVEFYKARFEAITPNLIQAMTTLGTTEMATKLAAVIAPLAIQEHSGLSSTALKVFKGTPLEAILNNLKAASSEVTVRS